MLPGVSDMHPYPWIHSTVLSVKSDMQRGAHDNAGRHPDVRVPTKNRTMAEARRPVLPISVFARFDYISTCIVFMHSTTYFLAARRPDVRFARKDRTRAVVTRPVLPISLVANFGDMVVVVCAVFILVNN